MTRVGSNAGYAGASVGKVSADAGVSRVTFYEYFGNREDCFRACCRRAGDDFVATVRARLMVDTADLWGLLRTVLDEVAADPTKARLVLLEAQGGPPTVRREHQRLLGRLESLIDLDNGGERPLIPASALLGGLVAICAMNLLANKPGELVSRQEQIIAWLASYCGEASADDRRWEELGRSWARSGGVESPCGSDLPVPQTRRERLIDATAKVTARKGFAAVSVADIVAAAGVQRQAFYAEFGNKVNAFRAVQIRKLERSMAAVAGQFALGSGWPDKVWRGLAALHAYLARHPHEARLSLLEVFAAGEEEMQVAQDSRGAFMLFLEEGYRQPAAAGAHMVWSEAVGATIYAVIRQALVEGRDRRLAELLPLTAFIALAPFMGADEALAFIELKIRGAGRRPRKEHSGRRGPVGLVRTGRPVGRV